MEDKLAWGILGNALIAQKCVMPAIACSRNGRIKALATSRPLDAEDVVKSNGIEQLYENYEDVIQNPHIDAVYVPLPNHLHALWTLKALLAGKHVLCEKPLACTAEEARQLARAAAANDCVLMEALMYRFHPRTQRVKTLISMGAIGVPHLVRAAFCFSMAEEILKSGNNYRLKSQPGGGALMDVGCYGVSVARLFLEREPVSVQAQAVYRADSEVDIHAVGNLRFDPDALATVEASFCSGLQQTYSIIGSKGAIDLPQNAFIPWDKDAVIYYRAHGEEKPERIIVPGADQYQLMIEHFGDQVRDGAKPLVTLEDSIKNLAVLDALGEAARTGCTVAVCGGGLGNI
jgi:predicted dehydrogenase